MGTVTTEMPSRSVLLSRASDEEEKQFQVDVLEEGPPQRVRVEGQLFEIASDGHGSLRIAAERSTTAWAVAADDVKWVFVDGRVFELVEVRPGDRARSAGHGHPGSLTAPMPATVRRVAVKVGDTVTRGDTLVILEAMKMELPVRAPATGTIQAVHCHEGELVQPGLVLIEIGEA
jgi:3-methylcrotonyl-CoA carboxylase alpha subunit